MSDSTRTSAVAGRAARVNVVTSPVVPTGALASLRLRPALAVLLASELGPDEPPGAVRRAIAMTFVALEFSDGESAGVLIGDRAVEPADGPITVWTGDSTDWAAECRPADFGDLSIKLGLLAERSGGLAAGELVVVPGATGEHTTTDFTPPGVAQLWGPGDAVLTVRFDEAAEAKR